MEQIITYLVMFTTMLVVITNLEVFGNSTVSVHVSTLSTDSFTNVNNQSVKDETTTRADITTNGVLTTTSQRNDQVDNQYDMATMHYNNYSKSPYPEIETLYTTSETMLFDDDDYALPEAIRPGGFNNFPPKILTCPAACFCWVHDFHNQPYDQPEKGLSLSYICWGQYLQEIQMRDATLKPKLPSTIIEELDLSSNNIIDILDDDLSGLYIRFLHLAYNPLRFITQNAFINVKGLVRIDFSATFVSQLPEEFFISLHPHLDMLYFDVMKIPVVIENYLHIENANINLPNLTGMSLIGNSLRIRENVVFKNSMNRGPNLLTLERLYLANNHMENIPKSLRYLPNLKLLELSENSIGVLQQYDLTLLNSLEYFSLGRQNIDGGAFDIHTDSLAPISGSLLFLYLDNNNLNPEFGHALSKLTALEHLQLQFCNISYLDPNIFNRMENLTYLSLNSNNINFNDSSKAFAGLTNENLILDLSNTSLSSIPRDVMRNLGTVTDLNLFNNNISYIGEYDFQGFKTNGLNLYSNRITEIHPKALQDVFLSPTIENDHFLYYLDLSDNMIQNTCFLYLLPVETFVYLFGNNILCTCDLYKYSAFVDNMSLQVESHLGYCLHTIDGGVSFGELLDKPAETFCNRKALEARFDLQYETVALLKSCLKYNLVSENDIDMINSADNLTCHVVAVAFTLSFVTLFFI